MVGTSVVGVAVDGKSPTSFLRIFIHCQLSRRIFWSGTVISLRTLLTLCFSHIATNVVSTVVTSDIVPFAQNTVSDAGNFFQGAGDKIAQVATSTCGIM